VVCDADPCDLIVFEVYNDDDSDSGDSSDSASCDYNRSPEIAALILDDCVAVDESESLVFSCTDTNDAMVRHFTGDWGHECSGSATSMTTVSELQGDFCAVMVACNVEAGDDYEHEEYEPETTSQSPSSSIECNHAILEEHNEVVIADVCYPYDDDTSSWMMKCHDGEPYVRWWALDTKCEGNHVFEGALPEFDNAEGVCDADPCHLAVFAFYHDESNFNIHLNFPETQSESDSSDAAPCNANIRPDLVFSIVDECVPIGDSESIKITCTGIHDAVIEHFKEDNDCSGRASSIIEYTADALKSEHCASVVACNVVAGQELFENSAPPLTAVVFAPFIVALAILNA